MKTILRYNIPKYLRYLSIIQNNTKLSIMNRSQRVTTYFAKRAKDGIKLVKNNLSSNSRQAISPRRISQIKVQLES